VSSSVIVFGVVLPWLIVALMVAAGAWIGFQLIQQNGRLLGRVEGLEQRLGQLQREPAPFVPSPAVGSAPLPQALAPSPAPAPPAGLPLGSAAPAFELPDLAGTPKSLAGFRGKKSLLIFFNPRCGFCSRMVPDLAGLPVDGRDGKPVPLVVTTGDAEENRKLFAEHDVHCPVLLQREMEIASQYQCHGTPMGYLVDEQGRIASEMAVGAPSLLALAEGPAAAAPTNGNGHAALGGQRTLAESKIQRGGLAAGTPAPSFTLPRLDGGQLSLEEYRGRPVLLVFSDPNCGPCDALAPQLEQAHRRSERVQVLMVSRGDEEANRAKATEHGLTFPIGLQRQWEISRDYAMFATPVAYLIDENGVIAADVVTGTDAILALLASTATGQTERRGEGRQTRQK
jgi:peroxiredoxin